MTTQWYLLCVQPQREKSTKTAIDNIVAAHHLNDEVPRTIVPTHSESHFKNDRRTTSEKVSFPGYVLVEARMTDQIQRMITSIPTALRFIADQDPEQERDVPVPMSDTEIANFLGIETHHVDLGLTVGDTVRITDGSFEDMISTVESIDPNTHRLTISINIFGRPTPVQVTADQVTKLN